MQLPFSSISYDQQKLLENLSSEAELENLLGVKTFMGSDDEDDVDDEEDINEYDDIHVHVISLIHLSPVHRSLIHQSSTTHLHLSSTTHLFREVR
jgi:hypothetical protein